MKWDDHVSNFKIVETIDTQIDIIKYEIHLMSPFTLNKHATRSNLELRTYKLINQSNQKSFYVIYTTSIESQNTKEDEINAITLRNCYIIESNDNKCKLYRLYRGDYMLVFDVLFFLVNF